MRSTMLTRAAAIVACVAGFVTANLVAPRDESIVTVTVTVGNAAQCSAAVITGPTSIASAFTVPSPIQSGTSMMAISGASSVSVVASSVGSVPSPAEGTQSPSAGPSSPDVGSSSVVPPAYISSTSGSPALSSSMATSLGVSSGATSATYQATSSTLAAPSAASNAASNTHAQALKGLAAVWVGVNFVFSVAA